MYAQAENSTPPVPTRITKLDELLNGGLRRGEITEICASSRCRTTYESLNVYQLAGGGPGLGKTQIAYEILFLRSSDRLILDAL